MTRSEEELAVDTVWRPAERVWVRRRVVEEEVTVTVTVRREELEIEREPASRFDRPRRDAGEPAEPLVMVLHEERPIVGVEVVPTEVVRVRRTVVRGGGAPSPTRCAGSRSRLRARTRAPEACEPPALTVPSSA
jgi:stress response protein YsnF